MYFLLSLQSSETEAETVHNEQDIGLSVAFKLSRWHAYPVRRVCVHFHKTTCSLAFTYAHMYTPFPKCANIFLRCVGQIWTDFNKKMVGMFRKKHLTKIRKNCLFCLNYVLAVPWIWIWSDRLSYQRTTYMSYTGRWIPAHVVDDTWHTDLMIGSMARVHFNNHSRHWVTVHMYIYLQAPSLFTTYYIIPFTS